MVYWLIVLVRNQIGNYTLHTHPPPPHTPKKLHPKGIMEMLKISIAQSTKYLFFRPRQLFLINIHSILQTLVAIAQSTKYFIF